MDNKQLKQFLDAKKSGSRLMGEVERHILARPLSNRSTTVLHPSEMIAKNWCHKYATYLLLGGTNLREKPNLRLQSIFDEGHAIHAKWQGYLAEMGLLYGRWTCNSCGKTDTNLTTTPSCPTCGEHSRGYVYAEVPLVYEKLRIAGHTDGWVKGVGDDFLIEIKSMGVGTIRKEAPELLMDNDNDLTKAWRAIRRPFRSHLLQGQMYLELARRMYGDDAPKEIVFIYELKADQDYKEFIVKANYEIVERIFHEAELVVDYAEAGKLPVCNVNSKEGCPSCKKIDGGEEDDLTTW
jgi:hypothetical protein